MPPDASPRFVLLRGPCASQEPSSSSRVWLFSPRSLPSPRAANVRRRSALEPRHPARRRQGQAHQGRRRPGHSTLTTPTSRRHAGRSAAPSCSRSTRSTRRQNGKSTGTIYVQDLGSKDPYSGITLFAPTFNPGNLAVSPGDVLDLHGQYTEASTIGSTVTFAPGRCCRRSSKPVATFRYETQVPEPVDIDVNDLADLREGPALARHARPREGRHAHRPTRPTT